MIVAYTAIFGGSDRLKAAPIGADRCVCFTDDPKLSSNGWEVVCQIPPEEKPRRTARVLKMTPHRLFPKATASIWVDGSIAIQDWPALVRDIGGAEIACLAHPDRSNCYDEGRMVIRLERACPSSVKDALELYALAGFRPTALSTTGLFFRRHTDRMAAFNELWRDHLDRFGTNDQVHVDYCAWRTGIQVTHLRGHYRDNPYAAYDKADHHQRRQPQFNPGDRCEHYLA